MIILATLTAWSSGSFGRQPPSSHTPPDIHLVTTGISPGAGREGHHEENAQGSVINKETQNRRNEKTLGELLQKKSQVDSQNDRKTEWGLEIPPEAG